MGKLSLVFPHPGIYEVLLGTAGVVENISPIGVRISDDFRIRVYSGSLTLQNLSIHPYCLLLITQDPVLFFKGLSGQLSPERWVYGLPAINGASCIFVAKCKLTSLGNPSEFLLSFISEMGECKEKSLSRGDGLFVDLLVHITRVDIVSKDERDKLFEIIKHETEVIRRTAPYLEPFLKRIEDSLRSKGYKLE